MTSLIFKPTSPLKTLLLVIVLMALAVAPGYIIAKGNTSEKRVEKTYKISDFSQISSCTGIEIVYTQGPSTGVAKVSTTLTGEKYLKLEVKNGCLSAYYQMPSNNNTSINGRTVVTVQSPVLTKIKLSSAGKFTATGPIKVKEELDVDLSSAGKALFKTINCPKLDADLSSAATVSVDELQGNLSLEISSAAEAVINKVSGTKSKIEVSSAASATLSKLTSATLSVTASSGGSAKIEKIESTTVSLSASSGGSIKLAGQCSTLSQSSSSGGTIDSKGLSAKQVAVNISDFDSDMLAMQNEFAAMQSEFSETQREAMEKQRVLMEKQREKMEKQRVVMEKQREKMEKQRDSMQRQMEKEAQIAAVQQQRMASGKTKVSYKKVKNPKKKDQKTANNEQALRIP